jgi:hypothetical protein
MRNCLLFIILFFSYLLSSQTFSFPEHLKKTMLANLKSRDSLIYYQCHVEELSQQISTSSGQTLTPAADKFSITEKYIIYRDSDVYRTKYFISSLIILPNRKFSGLKLKQRPYWNFKQLKDTLLSEKALVILASLEFKGKEPTEYDFAVTKYNTNQVIVKQRKDFRQRTIEGNYVISKLIFK